MHPAMAQMTITAVAIAVAALLIILLMPLLLSAGAAAVDPTNPAPAPAPIGMPNCVRSCGGVEVPYPFGIGPDARCYLPGFNLTCDTSRPGDARLLVDADGTLQVRQIPDVGVPILYAQHNGDVKIDLDAHGDGNGTFSRGLRRDGPYTLLGMENELILTGCNVQATVKSGNVTVASCTSLCHGTTADSEAPPTAEDDGQRAAGSVTERCSGGSTGCCRANIVTPGYYDDDSSSIATSSGYDVQLRWLGSNRSADLERLPVRGWFDNSSVSNDLLQTGDRPSSKETMAVPVWLTWEVVGSSVCNGSHSEPTTLTSTRRGGYACTCKQGYHGNPYLTNGCEDYDECKMWSQEDNGCYGECINTDGAFVCRCSPGTTGNYSIPGGCVNDTILADTGSCMRMCGDVEVPYPFGIGPSKCYMPGFGLACNTTNDPPQLLLGGGQFRVVSISLTTTTVRVIWKADHMPSSGFNADGIPGIFDLFPSFFNGGAPYSLSTSNELVFTGCNEQAILFGHGNRDIISGCASICSNDDIATINSTRSGVVGWPTNGIHGGSSGGGKYCYSGGCCQARISCCC